MLAPLLDLTVTIDDAGQDLGAAEVDADDAFSVQTARLPYWLDADGREALPRLPRRARQGESAARPAADAARAERPDAAGAARPPAAPTLELEAPHRADAALAGRADRDLVDRGLSLVPRRRREGERPHEQDVPGNR